jgi:hypothetical protein
MKHDDKSANFDWQVLTNAAQRAPRDDAPPPPPGLATRVLALVREQRGSESLWLSWCLRTAFASLAIALILPFLLSLHHDNTAAANADIESRIAELVFAP